MDPSPHERSLSGLRKAPAGSPARPKPRASRAAHCLSPGNAPEPAGKPGYSRNDVLRLQEICALTGDGLNLAGIRRLPSFGRRPTGRLQVGRARLEKLNRRDAR